VNSTNNQRIKNNAALCSFLVTFYAGWLVIRSVKTSSVK